MPQMGSYVWCLKEADRRTERQRETKRERETEIQTDSREADRTDIERHRDSNKERERERQRTIASYREKKIKALKLNFYYYIEILSWLSVHFCVQTSYKMIILKKPIKSVPFSQH